MKSLLLAFALLAFAAITRADATFRSGPAQVSLIELYTSEGCSSCPPAEKWMAGLREAKGLWTSFVPVAFHVNYWDHLGWKDRLASPAFTQREHAYAAQWRAASVYTPCFVRDGSEWRPSGPDMDRPTTARGAGLLKVTCEPSGEARVEYTPEAKVPPEHLDVSVALLGSGIVSKVRAGENSGRDLKHEFVALHVESVALRPGPEGVLTATVRLPSRPDITAPRHAVAAWITRRGTQTPLQATGGWLD